MLKMSLMYLSSIINNNDIISNKAQVSQDFDFSSLLQPWNDEVESFLLQGPRHMEFTDIGIGITERKKDPTIITEEEESIQFISNIVQELLLATISQLKNVLHTCLPNENKSIEEGVGLILQFMNKDDVSLFSNFLQQTQQHVWMHIGTNLSMLLRTCKNIIRFYRFQVSNKSQRHCLKNKTTIGNSSSSQPTVSPIHNLQTISMIYTYVHLFDIATHIVLSFSLHIHGSDYHHQQQQQEDSMIQRQNEDDDTTIRITTTTNKSQIIPTSTFTCIEKNPLDPRHIIDIFGNIAKQSATLLFYATFVLDTTDIHSNQALDSLIRDENHTTNKYTSSPRSGLYIILQHVPQLVSLPVLHSSILYPVMKLLQMVVVTSPRKDTIQVILEQIYVQYKLPWYTMSVFILQSCLQSYPPLVTSLPRIDDSSLQAISIVEVEPCHTSHCRTMVSYPPEYRFELIIETLRVLFAFENNMTTMTIRTKVPPTIVQQFHHILVYILLLPRTIQTQECKIATLPMFMDPSQDLIQTLVEHGDNAIIIPEFLYILKSQLEEVFSKAEEEMSRNGSTNVSVPIRYNSNVTNLLPIFLVLISLCTKHSSFQTIVRQAIFPQEDEDTFLETMKHRHDVILDSKSGTVLVAKNMHPIHAPVHSLRWQLIQLMTSVQTNVKRCTCELLWIVCNRNNDEYVLRTGFGNAVHFLGIKGLVPLSSISTT